MLPVFEPGMGCAKGWFVMDEKMLARFMAKVSYGGDNGCWTWIGYLDKCGYGRLSIPPEKVLYAHRLAFEHFTGPIPDGLQLDHLCRNRGCVNPAHLEPVTSRENTLRGNSHGALAKRTGMCGRGHKKPNIVGTCSICHNAAKRARRKRNSANLYTSEDRGPVG